MKFSCHLTLNECTPTPGLLRFITNQLTTYGTLWSSSISMPMRSVADIPTSESNRQNERTSLCQQNVVFYHESNGSIIGNKFKQKFSFFNK